MMAHWKTLFDTPFFPQDKLILVPSALVRSQIIEEILEEKGAVLGPKVLSFLRLEAQLASELRPREIGPWHKFFKLYQLAPSLWSVLGLPGEPAESRLMDLTKQLADGLDRLRLSGISWEEVEMAEPRELSRVVARLGREYEEFLAAFQDDVSVRRLLLSELEKGRPFEALKGVRVVYCQHADRFSPFEAEFLKKLTGVVERVELRLAPPPYIPSEKRASIRGYQSLGLVLDLSDRSESEIRLSWTDPETPERPECPAALHRVTNHLFDPGSKPEKLVPADCLTFVESPTLYHEAEEAGRALKKLLREGAAPHKLAVAVPSLEVFGPALEDVARRFGFFFRRKKGDILAGEPPVAAALSLLYLWDSRWELSRVIKILESPYFGFSRGGVPLKALYDSNIVDDRGGMGFFDYFKLYGEVEAGADRKTGDFRVLETEKNLTAIKKAGEELAASGGWREFESRFRSALKEFKWGAAEERGRTSEEDGGGSGFERNAGKDAVAAKAFMDVLTALFHALRNSSEAPTPGLKFFRLLLEKALNINIDSEESRGEGVHLLRYRDLHGAFFDELFLLGLNDKVYPRAQAESSYFPEDFIVSLSNILGRRLWSSAAERYQSEEEILTRALSQAKKVTLSWHRQDDNKRTLLPSPILDSIESMFEKGEPRRVKRDWPLPPKADKIRDYDELMLYLANLPDKESAAREYGRLFKDGKRDLFKDMERRRESLERMQETEAESMRKEQLKAWLASLEKNNYNGRPLISIRMLQEYKKCPRSFWYGHVLKLSNWEGGTGDFSSLEEGNLLHNTLRVFFLPLMKPNPNPEDLEFDRLEKIFTKTAEDMEKSFAIGRKPAFKSFLVKVKSALRSWHSRQENLIGKKIKGLEWPFDNDSSNPPFLVKEGKTEFYLKGRIDRIEEGENGGYRVIDYKTRGSDRYKNLEQDDPVNYPVQLYTMVVAEDKSFKTGKKDIEVKGFFEFIDPRTCDPIVEVNAGDRKIFANIFEQILTGAIQPVYDEENCGGCSFRAVCGGCLDERI
ncbi:MAG: PD-(D/E)XK nuclease family protein [Deltaproteobacteria bacterium]|jgi:ATP-dependent helicase/DNAse subunit B|nr:PD-(D/E)XK nuclease family protein [Deltaproteobacteria bacterium]